MGVTCFLSSIRTITLGRSIQVEHYVLMDQRLPMVHQQHTSPATFTRSKIYKEDPTERTWQMEDRYRIVLDKNIPFSAAYSQSFTANLTEHPTETRGIVNIFKFS